MKKCYEIPRLEVMMICPSDEITTNPDEVLSGLLDYGEGVEEW